MARVYLPVGDFNYDLNLQFLMRSPREVLHRTEDDTVYKALRAGDEKILIRISNGRGRLVIDFLNGEVSAAARSFAKDYVRSWFDLETDLTPFYSMASKDALLRGLVKKYSGYRIIGQPDLFESLVWAVLGQQINLQFAYTLKQRFVESFGEKLKWQDNEYYLFPQPAVVAGLNETLLLGLQFSRQKSRYTLGIAEAFATGSISTDKLRGMPLAEARDTLMKIKGVGNWTANYALMKTFRYPNAFPLEDAGLHNAIRNLKKMDRKPTLDEVRRIFKKYRGWEAYATLYLWKSLG